MTGESVLKRLRELNPQVKVILASGFLDPEQKNRIYLKPAWPDFCKNRFSRLYY
jgi:hypothetical protein